MDYVKVSINQKELTHEEIETLPGRGIWISVDTPVGHTRFSRVADDLTVKECVIDAAKSDVRIGNVKEKLEKEYTGRRDTKRYKEWYEKCGIESGPEQIKIGQYILDHQHLL